LSTTHTTSNNPVVADREKVSTPDWGFSGGILVDTSTPLSTGMIAVETSDDTGMGVTTGSGSLTLGTLGDFPLNEVLSEQLPIRRQIKRATYKDFKG
tara:strand:- start:497 stop:787 length:291 start_codon:yes stop_codon:yes gene_type:complete